MDLPLLGVVAFAPGWPFVHPRAARGTAACEQGCSLSAARRVGGAQEAASYAPSPFQLQPPPIHSPQVLSSTPRACTDPPDLTGPSAAHPHPLLLNMAGGGVTLTRASALNVVRFAFCAKSSTLRCRAMRGLLPCRQPRSTCCFGLGSCMCCCCHAAFAKGRIANLHPAAGRLRGPADLVSPVSEERLLIAVNPHAPPPMHLTSAWRPAMLGRIRWHLCPLTFPPGSAWKALLSISSCLAGLTCSCPPPPPPRPTGT